MGWTGIARREHSRDGLRYPSDLTDREWAVTAPFIPPAKSGGRRRTTDMREVVNALLYVASSGGAWRMDIGEVDHPQRIGPADAELPVGSLLDDPPGSSALLRCRAGMVPWEC